MYWISAKNKPQKEGIYVVAIFNNEGKMIEFSTDYFYLKEYGALLPNRAGGSLRAGEPTHYMTYAEYRMTLEAIPREDGEGNIVI